MPRKKRKPDETKNDLEYLRLEMQALGLKEKQADGIIFESLSGRAWSDLNEAEKSQVAHSLHKRIIFLRKFLVTLSCPTCQR